MQLKEELSNLYLQGFVNKFAWIAAYSKINGNEQAGALAKLGDRNGVIPKYFAELRNHSLTS